MRSSFHTSFIFTFLTFFLLAPDVCAEADPRTLVDEAMAQHVAALQKEGKYSVEDFNACQITSAVKELVDTDPYSKFTPYEITLYYEKNKIATLINSQGEKGKELEGLNLKCIEFNDFVYLFFDMMDFESRLKFGLTDLTYVIYSSDKGQTWSNFKSLSPLSKKTEFVIPNKRFSKHVKIFGDNTNHAISIYNIQDETTYLLDPHLNTLKTVSVYNRLSGFDEPLDFNYYHGKIYLVRGSCEMKGGDISCPNFSYREVSRDFGQTWEKKRIPFITASQFITYQGSFYHFTLSPCSSSWWKIIPALDKTNICGKLNVSKLSQDGKWNPPQTLRNRVNRLIGIYGDRNPVIVWQDLRFHNFRKCGFIPFVGCVDSGPFEGPHAIFAGELNMDTLSLQESLIKYDPKIKYFK